MQMRNLLVAALITIPVFGQSAEFEVASVKPSGDPGSGRVQAGIRIDGAQVTATFFSLRDYIGMAYGMKMYQISGPEWIASERFDIAAKLPAGATRQQIPEMVKALLEERFKLKVHKDKKEFPVYALVVAKSGSHLQVATDTTVADGNVNVTGGGDANGTSVNLGNGSSFTFSNEKFGCAGLFVFRTEQDRLNRIFTIKLVIQASSKGLLEKNHPLCVPPSGL